MNATPEKPIHDWNFIYGLALLPLIYWALFAGGIFSYIGVFMLLNDTVMDFIQGRDKRNYSQKMEARLSQEKYYRYFTYIQVPLVYLFITVCGYLFCQPDATWFERIGLLLSCGLTSGAIGITHAHELVHKNSKWERFLGGLLLSATWYATFKVEHVRGHHVTVSTPADQSSARLGQSLYHFLPRAVIGNVRNGFKLEAERLNRKGLNAWHWENELIWWTLLSLSYTLLFAVLFGVTGALFFVAQATIGFTLLEMINYVEHYGLERALLPNGKYERVTPKHSWNASEKASNYLLINLQRHSDHHAFPKRRYQILRHFDDSPQLPTGYPGMILLTLIPPLWRAIMDPRAQDYMDALRQLREEELSQTAAG